MTESDKRHLARPVLLERTRYIGFERRPVQNDAKDNRITGLEAASSNYKLLRGRRFIDMESK